MIKSMAALDTHVNEGVFHKDFMLQSSWAKRLYHDYAKDMPIVDYHNHLCPKQIAEDYKFESITQLWLEGDHYKWRAMRANGVEEQFITGNASDKDKFIKWASTVPNTLRNPLFHWTHLELKNPFGIGTYLNESNASDIYDHCNEQLKERYSVQQLLSHFNVKVLCTTDDPKDDLSYHIALKSQDFGTKVLPTFRPDSFMNVSNPVQFNTYVDEVAAVSNTSVANFDEYKSLIDSRHGFFHEVGCRVSDIGLEQIPAVTPNEQLASKAFDKLRKGLALDKTDADQFISYVFHFICSLNADRNWVQQWHLGPLRNNNSRLMNEVGADGGFDSISDKGQVHGMSNALNALNIKNKLAKTIAYNLNPALNDAVATMLGNFNEGPTVAKMQYGAAWWFLDQKLGIENQLNTLSNMGLLSHFVGMLTDSRSFVSFSRHDYFRRILCNLLGAEMHSGELPSDEKWVGQLVQDVCYNNAINYFDFDK